MKNKAVLGLALVVLLTAIATPIYVENEKQKAIEYGLAMEAIDKQNRSADPLVQCVDGTAFITVYSSISTMGAVWDKKSNAFVKCNDEGYNLNNSPVTQKYILSLAMKSGLYDDLSQRTNNKRNGGFPVIDVSAFVEQNG